MSARGKRGREGSGVKGRKGRKGEKVVDVHGDGDDKGNDESKRAQEPRRAYEHPLQHRPVESGLRYSVRVGNGLELLPSRPSLPSFPRRACRPRRPPHFSDGEEGLAASERRPAEK